MKWWFGIVAAAVTARVIWEYRDRLIVVTGRVLTLVGLAFFLLGFWIIEKGGAYCSSVLLAFGSAIWYKLALSGCPCLSCQADC